MPANTGRKRTGAWMRGQNDGYEGAAPDYGQATREEFQDYLDGYRKGKRERKADQEPDRLYPCDDCGTPTRCADLRMIGTRYYCVRCIGRHETHQELEPVAVPPLSQHPCAVHVTPLPWDADALLRVSKARRARG